MTEEIKPTYVGISPASKAKIAQFMNELPIVLDTGVTGIGISPGIGVSAISFPGSIEFRDTESITKPILYHELGHLHVKRMPKAQFKQLLSELNDAMEKVLPVTKERFKNSEDIVMALEEYVLGKLKPESPISEVYARWFPKVAIPKAEPVTPEVRLREFLIKQNPIDSAKKLGYEVHKLSPKNSVDKGDYAEGYRYRLSKQIEGKLYPDIIMARNEQEIGIYLLKQEAKPIVPKVAIPKAEAVTLSHFELYNTQYSLKQLQEMAKTVGLSPSGLKLGLLNRLVQKGVLK